MTKFDTNTNCYNTFIFWRVDMKSKVRWKKRARRGYRTDQSPINASLCTRAWQLGRGQRDASNAIAKGGVWPSRYIARATQKTCSPSTHWCEPLLSMFRCTHVPDNQEEDNAALLMSLQKLALDHREILHKPPREHARLQNK
jgi:hypothetical protein